MKRLIPAVSLFILIAVAGFAQNLSLSDSAGPLAVNSTVVFAGTPDMEIVSYAFVTNNSANVMDLRAKKVILDTIPGSLNLFCWDICYAPSVYVSNIVAIPAGGTFTSFTGHYTGNTSGVSHIRYVFFNAANPNDSVWFNVTYSAYPLGISENREAKISNAYPNPANASTRIEYSLPTGNIGSIVVRNVLGSEVKNVSLANTVGKAVISTSDLKEGIYFYSFIVNGEIRATRKLIVQH
jgi:hypothetical protein